MARIVVIGTSCSGKTTFARRMAQTLGIAHVELDAIHWQPHWSPRPTEEFRALTKEAVAQECWVMDGNYSKVRDIVWTRATHVIWLNYPFCTVAWRAICRTLRRLFLQEELYSGNRETFKQVFLSRDSILWWVLITFHRLRREYRALFDEGWFPHLTLIELRKPCEAEEFLFAIDARDFHAS